MRLGGQLGLAALDEGRARSGVDLFEVEVFFLGGEGSRLRLRLSFFFLSFFLSFFSVFVSLFSFSLFLSLASLRPQPSPTNARSCSTQTAFEASRPEEVILCKEREKKVVEKKEFAIEERATAAMKLFLFTSSQNSSLSTAHDWMFLSAWR